MFLSSMQAYQPCLSETPHVPKMLLSSVVASILFIAVATNAGEIDNKHLQCLVCRAAIREVKDELGNVDPKRNIDIGNYRLDAKGNEIKKTVPMARSAVHISDVLDDICEKKLSDYVRATYKSSGKLTILNLMSSSGGMNPEISKVDIVQDGDLNKSLEYLCREVIADDEERIIQLFQKGVRNVINEVCANICDETMASEDEELEEIETRDDVPEKTEL